MCNLYNQTTAAEAMRDLFNPRQWRNRAGNLPPDEIYPDRLAPVVRIDSGVLVLERARWGLPSPAIHLSPSGLDRGVTNVRNTGSAHWRQWLDRAHRCLVPFDAFAEPYPGKGAGNAWFRLAEGNGFFAGIRVPGWTSIRKVKDGPTTDDLFAFLTCPPSAEVAAIHPKAMPVILTAIEDWRAWLTADWNDAQRLQRPLPDGALQLISNPNAGSLPG